MTCADIPRHRAQSGVAALAVAILLTALSGTAFASTAERSAPHRGGYRPPGPQMTATDRRLMAASTITWNDLLGFGWARTAVRYVAGAHDYMADYPVNPDGSYDFHPAALESKIRFARAMVRAFAPDDPIDPSITFDDVDANSPAYRFANVAVQHGWLTTAGNAFGPKDHVTTIVVHRALVPALGLQTSATALDNLHTTDGHVFTTPANFGTTLLGMRLGLRHNAWGDESQDVGPTSNLNRAQVAYSLWRASTEPTHAVAHLAAEYDTIELPALSPQVTKVVQFGIQYVGYPYIWGGEWGKSSPEPGSLGAQPIPGFDCSGFAWWILRTNAPSIGWTVSPPRPYAGWALPQRWSFDMATVGHVRWENLQPGDLAFYHEGSGIGHVDVYIGNGWALDSSSGVSGVTIMWIGEGWYRNHFVHGRRIIPAQ
jgi:cell wall-associated NlpC family hydrolase